MGDRDALRVDVLGHLHVTFGGRAIAVPSGQMRTLLVSLVLTPGQALSVNDLAERLWPDQAPVRARGAVHTYVARLRRLLGPELIQTGPGGYRIRVAAEQVDLCRFRELLREAGTAESTDAELALLREALSLWRGRPFLDVESSWLAREVTPWLTDEWFAAVERRIDLELAWEHPGKVIPELRELIAEHPSRESLWLRLIEALHRANRRIEALEAYQQIRTILAEEFGVDPGEALQRIHQSILHGGGAAGDRPPAPSHSGGDPVRELPHDIANFTGRAELTQLDRLIPVIERPAQHATTIVAIDGAPGTGKTTLAVHWAHQVAANFPNLQLYVNLRGYGPGEPMSPSEAAESLLRRLGVPGEVIPAQLDERAALLRSRMAGRRALLLLDNARDAAQVDALLPGGHSLVILTSRSQLRGLSIRHGAQRITLGPLTADEALAMLAAVIGPERVIAEAEPATQLVDLCDRLPLAVAIVAERALRAESLREVVQALLDEKARLDLLGAGEDNPHTDLRAALSWSYRTLDQATAAMFRKLGLHPAADIGLAAAAALAGLPVRQAQQVLDRLVASHLVQQRRQQRYAMHDLIRRYATERAEHDDTPADRQTTIRRILDWYLHTVASADTTVQPHRPHDFLAPYEPGTPPPSFGSTTAALAWFEQDYDCLRSVVAWAAGNGWSGHAWRTAIASTTFFDALIPWRDGIEFYHSALRAAEHEDDELGQAFVLNSLGCIHLDTEDWATAERYFLRALNCFTQRGHARGEAMTSGNIGMANAYLGQYQRALRYSARALLLYRRLNLPRGAGLNLDNLGLAFTRAGKYQQAIRCFRRADAIFRAAADTYNIAMLQHHLGNAYLAAGEQRTAVHAYREAITAYRQLGNRRWEAFVLIDLGKCLHQAGHAEMHRSMLETAARTLRDLGDPKAEEIHALIGSMPMEAAQDIPVEQSHDHCGRGAEPGARLTPVLT